MPTGAFNICCPRDSVSRHNGGTSGAPLKPLRDDSALRALPRQSLAWGPIEDTHWNPSDHHSTTVLKGLRGPHR